jgi:hypothetical protein
MRRCTSASARPGRWAASGRMPRRHSDRWAKPRKTPALRAEAEWAMNRISGAPNGLHPARAFLSQSCRRKSRETDGALAAPDHGFGRRSPQLGHNNGQKHLWSVDLGAQTFGRPVVADGVVYSRARTTRER